MREAKSYLWRSFWQYLSICTFYLLWRSSPYPAETSKLLFLLLYARTDRHQLCYLAARCHSFPSTVVPQNPLWYYREKNMEKSVLGSGFNTFVMFQQPLSSWGLIELLIPLPYKCHVNHHNILVIMLTMLSYLHITDVRQVIWPSCYSYFNCSFPQNIQLPDHTEAFLSDCNNLVYTIVSTQAAFSMANSISDALFLYFEILYGVS